MEENTQIVKTEAVVSVQSQSDKVNRANRTLVQALVAFLASGTLLTIWNSMVGMNHIDPLVVAMVTPFLAWLVAYVQNQLEESGHTIPGLSKLQVPEMVIEEASVMPASDVTIERRNQEAVSET